jgi:hypothetical protein
MPDVLCRKRQKTLAYLVGHGLPLRAKIGEAS